MRCNGYQTDFKGRIEMMNIEMKVINYNNLIGTYIKEEGDCGIDINKFI